MTWYYNNLPFTEAPQEYQGFVYEIRNIATERLYIGKKNFWRTLKRPPLKGRVNRRHSVEETLWQQYYGSSNTLLADIEIYGAESCERTILYLCVNRTEMSYFETKTQFDRSVLLSDRYYNDYIGCKINGRGMGSGNSV